MNTFPFSQPPAHLACEPMCLPIRINAYGNAYAGRRIRQKSFLWGKEHSCLAIRKIAEPNTTQAWLAAKSFPFLPDKKDEKLASYSGQGLVADRLSVCMSNAPDGMSVLRKCTPAFVPGPDEANPDHTSFSFFFSCLRLSGRFGIPLPGAIPTRSFPRLLFPLLMLSVRERHTPCWVLRFVSLIRLLPGTFFRSGTVLDVIRAWSIPTNYFTLDYL